jgi:hypothetical protein
MFKYRTKPNVRMIIIIVVFIIISATFSYALSIYLKYNDPNFRSYVENRRKCDMFYSNHTYSTTELYRDFKLNKVYGC